ncbi:MAG: hypothetical protein OXF02_03545 [Simkaniaceae bacterium]|nr:hypothetical protein [Simkaniaceae bacterium]
MGDYSCSPKPFPEADALFRRFEEEGFFALSEREKVVRLSSALCDLIRTGEEKAFLLGSVFLYIDAVRRRGLCPGYTFRRFERWLNRHSSLTREENLLVRAKIAGKRIPGESYAIYFPVGMGKEYTGSHVVSGHRSPDIDTIIASFWGWVDAFAARVATAEHIWNIPGGVPESIVDEMFFFTECFGRSVFTCCMEDRFALRATAADLMLSLPSAEMSEEDKATGGKVLCDASIEEVREKIGDSSFLSVCEEEGSDPVGVIRREEVWKEHVGTVSLRDFSNREEVAIPPYLAVISVIDHHKTTLVTNSPPRLCIGDVQSANTLTAKSALEINGRYASGGRSEEEVDAQLGGYDRTTSREDEARLIECLLRQKQACLAEKRGFFVHPQREIVEYLHFIYAILDDTDFLAKVTRIDVECMAMLLNRLKSIVTGKMTETVHFDDIEAGPDFNRLAADRLLSNRDLHSLYSKVYERKKKGLNDNMEACASGRTSSIFLDTKILNRCNRVGQTKIFACNYATFGACATALRNMWYDATFRAYRENPELLLHLHMISTVAIAGGTEREEERGRLDEMWMWVPETREGEESMRRFLSSLSRSPVYRAMGVWEALCVGDRAGRFGRLFQECFPRAVRTEDESGSPNGMVILKFDAGRLNSRKAMITPYLPPARSLP